VPAVSKYPMEWKHGGKPIMKGSDDSVMYFEESCFRTLSVVQYFSLKQRFGTWLCFRRQVRGGGHLLCEVP
jgi:hypothetical protein